MVVRRLCGLGLREDPRVAVPLTQRASIEHRPDARAYSAPNRLADCDDGVEVIADGHAGASSPRTYLVDALGAKHTRRLASVEPLLIDHISTRLKGARTLEREASVATVDRLRRAWLKELWIIRPSPIP